ncbi:Bug family tripartite tricarboxylate transporter substrate binding protein [Desertihabitans aurantiacus]|uniref:Bug family tripartite tricarboxylate transporter substrate binding protein n=1 Tax=Desertihabitans aurantiacus TaxID=2282477 RepID=UPI001E3F0307|nr:tripartite tricarboxylate transporter substrate-binding protein [Desertihabitans aurantiacus]
MQNRRLVTVLVFVVAVPLLVAAVLQARAAGGISNARSGLTLLVPAAPGGGWDTVARELQRAMRENGVVTNPRVVNVPGAGGTIGLSQLDQMQGRDDVLMVMGTVMIGGIVVNDSALTLADTTPVAELAEDYEAMVVPADSPFQSVDDVAAALREDPGAVAIGGGSLGGTDHLTAGLLAQDVGADPAAVNYIPFAGGGEAVNALLSSSVDVGISGYVEFADQVETGALRLLALSAPEPQPGIDAPTFIDAGYDVYLPNFRGVVAPRGLDEEQVGELTAIVEETVATPEWQDALQRNQWIGAVKTGPEYQEFLDAEVERTTALAEELGL